jgi:dTDP-4-dehydrorhamnose 3,5-epimerase
MMEVTPTALPGVLRIHPRVFRDHRGTFLESWQRERYREAGLPEHFVQDNVAHSVRGVIRGLHYQYPEPQGKLVMALLGEVFDVAVDVRRGSPTFGQWIGERISAEEGTQLWIPEGFAHGYAALTERVVLAYKCTRGYRVGAEHAIHFGDPALGISWPVTDPIVSEKDAQAPRLAELPDAALPPFEGH